MAQLEHLEHLEGQALRDARWVLSFGAGTVWCDEQGSGFRPNRLAQLKEAGVLLAHPTEDGLLVVGN